MAKKEIKKLTPVSVHTYKEKDGEPIIINTRNGDKQVYKVGVKFQELGDDQLWWGTCWNQEKDSLWKIEEGKEYTLLLDYKYTSFKFPSTEERLFNEVLAMKEKLQRIKFTQDERVIPLLEEIANGEEIADDFEKSETDEIHENAGDDIDPDDIPF